MICDGVRVRMFVRDRVRVRAFATGLGLGYLR